MGHGIAQVFALAGHEVTITDTVMANLDSVKARIAANLSDLGDDAARGRARDARSTTSPRQCATPIMWSRRCPEDLPLKQKLFAEIERHVRPRHHPGQQHLGDPDHRDHGGPHGR